MRTRNPFSGLPREVGVLVVVAFCVALGFGIVGPAIPLFARQFGVSNFAAGGVISIFAAARLVAAPVVGRLVDHIGERTVLSIGIWIVAISSILAGFSQSYEQLLFLRGAGGVGSAMFTVSALSLLLRVAGPEQRGRASSAFQGGFLIGGITGPFIGGFVTAWSVRAPFFFYAGTLIIGGTYAAITLASSPLANRAPADVLEHVKEKALSGFAPLWEALRNRAFVTAMFINLANGFTAFGMRASLTPSFVKDELNRSPVVTGTAFLLSALVTAGFLSTAGRMSDTRGRKPTLAIGTGAVALGMGLLAVTGSVALFFIAMGILGVGSAFMGSAPAAVVGDVAGARGGTVIAAFQMASDVGSISGPLIAGWIADGAGFGPAFATGAVVSLVGLLLAGTMPETLRRTAAPPSGAPAPT